jgi:hypothetical protein
MAFVRFSTTASFLGRRVGIREPIIRPDRLRCKVEPGGSTKCATGALGWSAKLQK